MRCFWTVLLALLPVTIAMAQTQAAPNTTTEFDGLWSVVQDCPASGTAKSYSLRYGMAVKNGFVRAQYGSEGKPNSFTITGQIKSDGTVTLVLNGLTGDSDRTAGNVPPGTSVGFTIPSTFAAKKGIGHRTQTRPCTFTFNKQ
jgi:hypothetical protein